MTLAFLARQIREHYYNKEKRSNKISARLIGKRVISLARYSFTLFDALKVEGESGAQKKTKNKPLALEKWLSISRMLGPSSTM